MDCAVKRDYHSRYLLRFFFFSSRRRHTRSDRDWSSDVCSSDLEAIEANGTLPDADPDCVSDRAKERGKSQLGTVGSGNHFVEVGYVAERYDERVADRLGLGAATVTVFIHSGSRGLGYQVCDDHLEPMLQAAAKYGIAL